MLVAEHYQDPRVEFGLPKPELLEIHRSKISIHHAKKRYDYPSIRLPHTFIKLAGLSTKIYQTVHEGALAFLVVVSLASENSVGKHENASSSDMHPAFTRRKSPIRIRPSPWFIFSIGRENQAGS
jgi:hypothetical protein